MAIIDEIKMRFRSGSLLLKLIYINIGVFVMLKLAMLVCSLLGVSPMLIAAAVELPSQWIDVLHRPWTLITYMFMHGSIMHIFMNMLCLYWFGVVFMEYNTPKQLVALYVLSGFGGAAVYLAAYALLPSFAAMQGNLVGASAAVLGIMVAIGLQAPNYRINLLFIGAVAMKWVVMCMLLIVMLSYDGTNMGGDVAHIGGAIVGALYALLLRKGCDITKAINRTIDAVVGTFAKRKPSGSGKYHYSASAPSGQKRSSVRSRFVSEQEERVDAILEKIKQSGYSALTQEEKEIIFSVGRKNEKKQ